MTADTISPARRLASAHPHRVANPTDGDLGAAALDAAFTTLAIDAAHPPTPTMLFRVALRLRHNGYADQADELFRQSSRLLSEQYVDQRLRMRRPRVA